MKVETTTTQTNLNKGREILRRAVSSEKQAARYWAQYVQWTVEEEVPLAQIAEQLMEAKSWTVRRANTYARDVVLLGQEENRIHLENLMNGEIDFTIACLRVNPPTPKKASYQDDETAVQLVQKAVAIMKKCHSKWSSKDYNLWFASICEPLINQKDAKQG